MLLFRGFHMTPRDDLAVAINGTPIAAGDLLKRDNEVRVEHRHPIDEALIQTKMREGYSREVAESFQPAPDPPFVTYWFTLGQPPVVYGWNELKIELINADPGADGEIVIEQVEVFVIPDVRT